MSAENKFITRWSRDFQGNLQEDPNGSWVLAADAAIREKRLMDKIDSLQVLLTAADEELDQCQSMALMIEEKEWAEHVGTGPISSRVESAFTQMHNELSEARQGLTAADERADVLTHLLREGLEEYKDGDDWIDRVIAALKPAEFSGEPNCLLCLDKKTVPSNLAEGYVMDCPDCCGEEG